MDNLKTQGISMPKLGLGTFRMQGDACRAAVESALATRLSPYRHRRNVRQRGSDRRRARGGRGAAQASCMSRQRSGTRIWRPTRSAAPSMPA